MERPRDALPEGTKLAGYIIGRVLGRGGFGVTYLGHDALFPEAKVAIKEFLPSGLAVREAGSLTVHPSNPGYVEDFGKALSRFEEEARTLVALRHPNVVEVQRYIEANGTAYVVMKYEEGRSLSELLGGGGTLSAAELADIVSPLLDGLEAVHKRNYLHRDIKPGNIYIRAADGSPVLLDFGAARQAMGAERKTSLTEIVTPGYAPFEQYFRKGEQGPWTDIYALGATFYRCIAGAAPPEAPERLRRDAIVPAREAGRGRYPDALLAGIDAMLTVHEKDRPQSISEIRKLLGAGARAQARSVAPAPTLIAEAPPPKPASFEWQSPATAPKPLPRAEFDVRPTPPPSRAGNVFWTLMLAGALVVAGYYISRPGPTNSSSSTSAKGTDIRPPASRPAYVAGTVFRDCPQCPELVIVPAGSFTMGSPESETGRQDREGPQQRITFPRPFAMGRFEVTYGEFDACTSDGGCTRRPYGPDRGRVAVVNVRWGDIREYIAWLSRKTGKNYRLPSEAEWEYGARAGTTTPFSTGWTISTNQANFDGTKIYGAGLRGIARGKPVTVGSFAANAFGIHDMHGNAGEWVEDCWNLTLSGAPPDGRARSTGNCEYRVLRGGTWADDPVNLRSAWRAYGSNIDSVWFGFRVAQTLD